MLYLVRPGLKTLWGLKKTFQEFQLSSTYVLTPSSRKINLIINSTHLSRLISANCTFHICDHNRSFSQTKKHSFHKISFSIDPYFSHYAALVKNSKQRLICCRVKCRQSWRQNAWHSMRLRLLVSLTHVVALEADYWLTGRSNEIVRKETCGRVT